MRELRALLLLAIGGLIAWGVFSATRAQARESSSLRGWLIVGTSLGMLAGAVLALWLPRRVPETSGSPASLVAIVLLWIVGGGLLFVSSAGLLGALMGRREPG